MNKKMLLFLLSCFLLIASNAFANMMMSYNAASGFLFFIMLLWLIIGFIIFFFYRDIVYLGGIGLFLFIIFTFFAPHPNLWELGIYIWMIYITFLTVYFAFKKEGITPLKRWINLIFHGIFLVAVVIGGIIAKYFYWKKMGGFAAWRNHMSDNYSGFLVIFIIVSLFVALGFYLGVVKKEKNKNSQSETLDITNKGEQL